MEVIGLRNLCTPAYIYLLLSFAALFMIGLQNALSGSTNNYCVGIYSCSNVNVFALFALKILFILFWTWILNILCKSVSEVASWALVLLPLILMFLFIAIVFFKHIDLNKYVPSIGFN